MKINRINLVIDCSDAKVMADFYQRLLGWELTHPPGNGWAAITSATGEVIAFQETAHYQPPVWPWEANRPGQMLHLDFWVDNLEEGIQFALECGAELANRQFFSSSRTMLDPAGHPFCIDTPEP